MEQILGFFGEHRWLSNFWLASVTFEGAEYPSTEAAYQAAKSLDPEIRAQFQDLRGTSMQVGKAARKLGRKLTVRPDWDHVKFDVMLKVTREKYKHPDLKALLLATGDAYLEETNDWGDQFWGVCRGVGTNHLGVILMRVRQELKDEVLR